MIVTNNAEFDAAIEKRSPTVTLVGDDFRMLKHTESVSLPITVYAYGAKVRGVSISGCNLTWFGGEVVAQQGADGNGPPGYGFRIFDGASGIRIESVKLREANRAIVLDRASHVAISGCDFSVRQDGIIGNLSEDLIISGNKFHDFQPQPGDHSDAIQLRNAIKRCKVIGNTIRGVQQGIGQMDAPTDRPLSDVAVIGNYVGVTGFHSITFGKCDPLTVTGNTVEALTLGRKTTYRLPPNAEQSNNRIVQPWR